MQFNSKGFCLSACSERTVTPNTPCEDKRAKFDPSTLSSSAHSQMGGYCQHCTGDIDVPDKRPVAGAGVRIAQQLHSQVTR